MKRIILQNLAPCNVVKFKRPFEGTYRLYLQGQRENQMGSKQIPEGSALHSSHCENLESTNPHHLTHHSLMELSPS
jgi:hypothetical protein